MRGNLSLARGAGSTTNAHAASVVEKGEEEKEGAEAI
jgi:hypothetical protein